jgi:pimeloyl-ACP methyl ester carboxylesterase
MQVSALSGSGSAHRPIRWQTENRLPAYAAILVPLPLVGFADDVLAPATLGREIDAAVPSATCAEFSDCSHLGFLGRPEAFNEILLRFLSAPSPSPIRSPSGGTHTQ